MSLAERRRTETPLQTTKQTVISRRISNHLAAIGTGSSLLQVRPEKSTRKSITFTLLVQKWGIIDLDLGSFTD